MIVTFRFCSVDHVNSLNFTLAGKVWARLCHCNTQTNFLSVLYYGWVEEQFSKVNISQVWHIKLKCMHGLMPLAPLGTRDRIFFFFVIWVN